jgi:hypothetical protein
MKMILGSTFLLIFAVAMITRAQGTEEQKKNETKSEKTVAAFMRQKLDLSKRALEGIVNEDFALIKESAEEMEKMGRDKQWQVLSLDEYSHFSAEFRRVAKVLRTQAERKNIDGSVVAYVQLTMSCVECHKFTRGVKLAGVTPVIQTDYAQQ